MIFYYSILLITGFFSLLEIKNLNKKETIIIFFYILLLLYVLSFIRWETGTDWDTYYSIFLSSFDYTEYNGYEPIFSIINTFANNLTDGNYTFCLFILATILYYFQIKGLYKLSVYPLTSLFLLIGIQFGSVNFVRQTIATAILFYSTYYIQQKKLIPFLSLVLLAFLFHRTSLIFLLAWKLFHMQISRKMMIILLIASIGVTTFITLLLNSVLNLLGPIIQHKLNVYMNDYDAVAGTGFSATETIIKGVLNKCVILIFFFTMWEKIIGNGNNSIRGYLNLYWFGAILYFSLVGINIVFVRFSYVFDLFIIILFPYLFKVIQKDSNRILLWLALFLYSILKMYMYLNSYYDLFIPFRIIDII